MDRKQQQLYWRLQETTLSGLKVKHHWLHYAVLTLYLHLHRHRLNRSGNRAANNAIWTIAMVRMRNEPRTKVYVERRTAEGLSQKDICRCLKRYIVRELYPVILDDLSKINHIT